MTQLHNSVAVSKSPIIQGTTRENAPDTPHVHRRVIASLAEQELGRSIPSSDDHIGVALSSSIRELENRPSFFSERKE